LAKITVDTSVAVVYDGSIRYKKDPNIEYIVEDTVENYQKAQIDVANGLITITEAFTNQTEDPLSVEVTGSLMELYGATVDNRPAADSVPVGACFMAVNTGQVWQSNGSDWVVRA